jgi:hypothetical protein
MADPVFATLLCLVVAISDGDTLKVRCERQLEQPAQTLTVRLAEIDAPEKRQAFGTRSRAHLATLCFGRFAIVNVAGKDRYGRSIGRVTMPLGLAQPEGKGLAAADRIPIGRKCPMGIFPVGCSRLDLRDGVLLYRTFASVRTARQCPIARD